MLRRYSWIRGSRLWWIAVAPEHRMEGVTLGEQVERLVEEVEVAHPPGDLAEIDPVHVVLLQVGQHFGGRPPLRDVVPRGLVDLAQPLDDVERERVGPGRDRFVTGDVHRVVREVARLGEVEVVLELLRRVGAELQRQAARPLAAEHRHRLLGDLHQDVELLRGRGRVGHHHLAAVDDAAEELVGHVLVPLLAVDLDVAVAVAEEVLADQHRRLVIADRGLLDLLVEDDGRRGGLDGEGGRHPASVTCSPAFDGQVEHGQREHHLAEVRRRHGDVLGEERSVAAVGQVCGVVAPEGVDLHQVGQLVLDQHVVVVVLGPLLDFRHLAVEPAARLTAGQVAGTQRLLVACRGRRSRRRAGVSPLRRDSASFAFFSPSLRVVRPPPSPLAGASSGRPRPRRRGWTAAAGARQGIRGRRPPSTTAEAADGRFRQLRPIRHRARLRRWQCRASHRPRHRPATANDRAARSRTAGRARPDSVGSRRRGRPGGAWPQPALPRRADRPAGRARPC